MNEVNNDTAWKEVLYQSDLFGDGYKKHLDQTAVSVKSLFSYQDVQDMYSTILIGCRLSEFQQESVSDLFTIFNTIRGLIDPDRLKSFNFSMSNENELLIFRKSSKGLTNIIIHDEECIAFSYIPFDPESQTILRFAENGDSLEKLAYLFFSY
jgi:hypothetical protein